MDRVYGGSRARLTVSLNRSRQFDDLGLGSEDRSALVSVWTTGRLLHRFNGVSETEREVNAMVIDPMELKLELRGMGRDKVPTNTIYMIR
jgi:hypothetical protein